jgi:hypothetical protein
VVSPIPLVVSLIPLVVSLIPLVVSLIPLVVSLSNHAASGEAGQRRRWAVFSGLVRKGVDRSDVGRYKRKVGWHLAFLSRCRRIIGDPGM